MKRKIFILFVIIVPFTALAQRSIVIDNVAVIDVRTGKVNKDRTVVIHGNRIISVSSKASTRPNATTIDGHGKF